MQHKTFLILAFLLLSNTSYFRLTADHLSKIGTEPQLAPIEAWSCPNSEVYITPTSQPKNENSLWAKTSSQFLENYKIGDIIKVNAKFSDNARLKNSLQKQRKTIKKFALPELLEIQNSVIDVPTDENDNQNALIDLPGSNNNLGKGRVDRYEKIDIQISATVKDILQNGNLLISGTQEIKVNYEIRYIYISGMVGQKDIEYDNTIDASKIADLRICMGEEKTLC